MLPVVSILKSHARVVVPLRPRRNSRAVTGHGPSGGQPHAPEESRTRGDGDRAVVNHDEASPAGMPMPSPGAARETNFCLVGVTPDGIVESWNRGAERLLGYAHHEAVGQSTSVFFTAADQRTGLPEQCLRQAQDDGGTHHVGRRRHRDGREFWGSLRLTALHGESGVLLGFGVLVHDLTETLRRDATRETFYDTFLHDVRVPLAAVKGFSELAADAEPGELPHLLGRVGTNADRLLAITEDLVERARVLDPCPSVSLAAVDLAALARQVVEDLVPDGARIAVSSHRVMALADPVSLYRVIAHVLTNAINYSAPGSPISVVAEVLGSTGVLRVTDRGRGIDPGDREVVFAEHARGRFDRPDGGSGPGLTSARGLVESLGGTMRIGSGAGAGTTITITLPAPALPA